MKRLKGMPNPQSITITRLIKGIDPNNRNRGFRALPLLRRKRGGLPKIENGKEKKRLLVKTDWVRGKIPLKTLILLSSLKKN